MSALIFVAHNAGQLLCCALIAAFILGVACLLTTEPYTPDRPERPGDLGTLDHRAGKHERGERG